MGLSKGKNISAKNPCKTGLIKFFNNFTSFVWRQKIEVSMFVGRRGLVGLFQGKA